MFENEFEQYRMERTRLYNHVLSAPDPMPASSAPITSASASAAASASATGNGAASNPSSGSASGSGSGAEAGGAHAVAVANANASAVPSFEMSAPAFEQHYLTDTALLVPPLATPFSRIALHKRLACGADEQFKLVRYGVRAVLTLSSMCRAIVVPVVLLLYSNSVLYTSTYQYVQNANACLL